MEQYNENNNPPEHNTPSTFSQQIDEAKEEGKHSVHIKQKERQVRKKRKKLKRIKTLFRFLLFLFIIFVIYKFLNLPQWYLKNDTFSKPDGVSVEIINNKIVPSAIIYNSLKEIKVAHIPIFFMSVKPIKKELAKIPVIKKVYVRRFGFPARVKIIVRERTPMAVIKTDLKARPVAFITTDKKIITDKYYMHMVQSDSTLCILAKNPNIKKDWTVSKVLHIEKIAKAVESYSKEKVEYIDMKNPNDVYVKINSVNIRLGVLDSTVFERIKRIYTILPELDGLDEKIKYVDLSWDKVNYLKIQKSINEETKKNNEL